MHGANLVSSMLYSSGSGVFADGCVRVVGVLVGKRALGLTGGTGLDVFSEGGFIAQPLC